MLNREFDPFDLLEECRVQINNIIRSHNSHDELLVKLIKNHNELSNLVIQTAMRTEQLERTLNQLQDKI